MKYNFDEIINRANTILKMESLADIYKATYNGIMIYYYFG